MSLPSLTVFDLIGPIIAVWISLLALRIFIINPFKFFFEPVKSKASKEDDSEPETLSYSPEYELTSPFE